MNILSIWKNDPNALFSYNPSYHNATTFIPVNIKKLENEERSKSIAMWRSKEGWVYPDVKTTMQSNQHPKKPDQSSIDKLYEVFHLFSIHSICVRLI